MELITIIRQPLKKGLSDTQRAVLRGFQTKNNIEDKDDDTMGKIWKQSNESIQKNLAKQKQVKKLPKLKKHQLKD